MRLAVAFTVLASLVTAPQMGAQAPGPVAVGAQWEQVTRVSVTVPTTQHLANTFTLRSSPLNKKLLEDLRNLHTNDTRLQLWFSVPNQAVPELKEPTATETFWNFKYIDPVVIDFFANTTGLHHVNIGTIPRWMFNVPEIALPSDPGGTSYQYAEGTKGELLKDPSGKQFAEYQARIFQWYTQGGFTDEIGRYHKSGHHFNIDFWGVLNEPSFENHISPEEYTRIYDQVAIAIHKIDPDVEFFGPEIVGVPFVIPFATYYLNPKNHDPAAPPVKWFSLHNYVMSTNNPDDWQAAYFTGPAKEIGDTA